MNRPVTDDGVRDEVLIGRSAVGIAADDGVVLVRQAIRIRIIRFKIAAIEALPGSVTTGARRQCEK